MKDIMPVRAFMFVVISVSVFITACFVSYFLYNGAMFLSENAGSGYNHPSISGYGISTVDIDPNSVVFNFTLNTPSDDIKTALQKHFEAVGSLEKSLIALGLTQADIVKSGYQYCVSDCSAEVIQIIDQSLPVVTPQDSGSRISQVFTVSVKNLAISKSVVDIFKANKNIEVKGTNFSAIDYKDKLQLARTEALKKAHEQALSMAKVANIKLGKIISINDSTSSYYTDQPQSEVTVSVDYEIED